MKPTFPLVFAGLACALSMTPAQATTVPVVILDTDFTTADGFNAGNLQFQQGFLGQPFAQVDPTGSGAVVSPAVTPTGGTPFSRNVFNQGVTGGSAGNAGTLSSSSFAAGDQVRVVVEYQFTLSSAATTAGTVNTQLANIGFREGFGNTEGQPFGFEAAPQFGFDGFFNIFGTGISGETNVGGTLQLFPNSTASGPANGIFIAGQDVGLDPNGGVTGTVDLESDPFQIEFLIESDGAGTFSVEQFTFTNLANPTDVRDFDLTASPQSFTYLATVNSSGAPSGNGVTIGTPAPDAFFSLQLSPNANNGFVGRLDSALVEFIPAIPEPSSAVLLSLAGVAALARRRR